MRLQDLNPVRIINNRSHRAWYRTAHLRSRLGWSAWRETPESSHALYRLTRSNVGIAQIESEVIGFHDFLRRRSPRVVCELGTELGGHLFMLSKSLPTVEKLIGADLRVQNRAFLLGLSGPHLRIELIDGNTRDRGVIEAVSRAVGDDKVDVLFIDGDHSYEGVKADFMNYRGLVRDGGVVAFHDIVQDYTTRYGRWTMQGTGEVPVFWSRIKTSMEAHEFVSNPDQDGFGIGVLIYDSKAPLPADL